MSAKCWPGRTADSRSMPRCAWPRTIAPGPIRKRGRLLRYCARPPFALERLELLDAGPADYQLPKRRRNRATALVLTAPDFIDHLAALILPQEMRRGQRRRNGDSV